MTTNIVVWDIDKVWYPDISTTYCARGSTADHKPYLKDFVENKGWFTYDHVHQWEEATGRPINSIGALADMLTDFLYKMKSTVYAGVSDQDAKTRTIEGKQALLKGLTIGDVKRIADAVPYTDGLKEAIDGIYKSGIGQIGFSDGLGPFVAYHMRKQGVDVGGVVPAAVETAVGTEGWFDISTRYLLDHDQTKLLGKTGPFKKSDAIFTHLSKNGYEPHQVTAIDDSGANVGTLAKIRDNGGIAIGFKPTKDHMPQFEAAKIPVMKGTDLRPFAELVTDPRKVREYCETWGLDV